MPGETSVDFVPCLKASAACGFLTCQSAILTGLGDSYRLGDGPPRIYAEHTPNKKCKERDGNRKMTERLTSAGHILANITRYHGWNRALKQSFGGILALGTAKASSVPFNPRK